MNFIEAEEFLKQDKRVQKVFLDWWKPNIGDLIVYKYLFKCVDEVQGTTIRALSDTYHIFKNECVPLFAEGQLRQFIEDKTGYKATLVQSNSLPVEIWLSVGKNIKRISSIDKFDVLQAYWKVACEIAKGEVN